jgi:hypothetical protein
MRREIPLIITFAIGLLMVVQIYIPHYPINKLEEWATMIVMIISAFALILGGLNLNRINLEKVSRKRPGWGFSIILIVSFWVMILAGTFHLIWLKIWPSLPKTALEPGSPYWWLYENVQIALSASMFSMLAFFVASASYRAFRARTPEATLLLLAAFLVMLGQVPIGDKINILGVFAVLAIITGYVTFLIFKKSLGFLAGSIIGFVLLGLSGWLFFVLFKSGVTLMSDVSNWIMNVPNTAGQRAVGIGIGIGIIATSLRIILGIEKSFVGGD